jgi:MFS family permease
VSEPAARDTRAPQPFGSPGALRRSGAFVALREREFRVLWIGTVASYVGFFMSTIVQSVVAFELTGTNRAVGYVVFAQGLAMLALGPLGGAGADRWPKRRVLAISQCASALVFATLALLLWAEALHIGLLASGSLVLGASIAFLGPARQALSAELVPDAVRGNAIVLNQVALTGSQVLGPAIAGFLLASPLGASGAYGAMASLYAFAAFSLLRVPRSVARAGAGDTHVLEDLLAGLRYVWTHPRLRLLVLFFVSVIMTGFPYVTVLPGLVEHRLGREADAISTLYFVAAVGGLGASLLAARLADTRWALPLFVGMALVFATGLFALSRVPSYRAALGAMAGLGVGIGGFQSLNGAVIVRAAEPAYLGRVFSLTILAFAGFGMMGLPIGLLADAIGERGALLAMSGVVCSIVVCTALLLARR